MTQVQIRNLIRDKINPMLAKNYNFTEITEELMTLTGKGKAQCEKYIKQAVDILKESFNADIEQQRVEVITALRYDLTEAYSNYQKAENDRDAVAWWKEYQAVKKRITEICPVEKNPDHKSKQPITVTYRVVEGNDDE